MGQDHPLLVCATLAAAALAARWWWTDFQAARRGTPAPQPLPGATPATPMAVGLAVAGALLLLAAETCGEYRLDLVAQQSRLTALAGAGTLAAAFVEELVFRGYLVCERRGPAWRWAGIVAASVLFALLHPFLWEWRAGGLRWLGGTKAWFSTGAVFAGSLWFYAVRFWGLNPTRSLWPCIAAHTAKNLGVLAVKYGQGYLGGWW